MSQKITAKNLSYNQALPPFLAALHDQAAASRGDGPDPILAGRRRAVKARSGSAEAEDAPLVLDAAGNEVAGVKVGVDGAVTETAEGAGEGEGGGGGEGEGGVQGKDGGEGDGLETGEKVAGIGAGRKRKVGRVVGGGDEDGDEKGGVGARKRLAGEASGVKKDAGGGKSSKPKKKAKKIKLSFGDDNGD